jgi:type IV secretion system protein VirD4
MKMANAVKRCFKRSNSGNSGVWATDKDIRTLIKTPENGGVVIGGFDGKPMIYGGNDHVVAVVGPESVKTSCLMIPTLLTYPGSVVVHDVGGELYEQTADHRRDMGQKVIRFAPGEADSPRFNPLDIVRFGTEHELDDVKWIAALICPRKGKGFVFREKQAYVLIVALLLHGINKQGPSYTLADACKASKRPEIFDELAQDSAFKLVQDDVKSMLRNFSHDAEKNGVMSIARDNLQDFVGAFHTSSSSTSSDFNLNELQNGDTPVTLYLVSDPANVKRVTPIFQVLLSAVIKTGMSTALRCHDGHMLSPNRHKLLLLMDDYASFEDGVPGLSDGIAFMAAYEIQSFITVQNADQLKALGTIVGNSHIRIFLPPADMETAEYLSEMLGDVGIDCGIREPLMITQNSPDDLLHMPRRAALSGPAGADAVWGVSCFTLRAGNAPIFGSLVPFWQMEMSITH